ncbi:Divalent-cation tolerance protein CutA [uncultured archaeon]|nr:Divalent-cation tolerance protein CutA [uncultured archaeon]
MAIVLLYVPFPSLVAAKKCSKELLSLGLIACANIFRTTSAYSWKGRAISGVEFVCVMKTSMQKAKAAEIEILKMHPYELPAIIKINAGANKGFEEWVCTQEKQLYSKGV